jgi:hypothetical protein
LEFRIDLMYTIISQHLKVIIIQVIH